ncbi:hypothetical protein [Schnuerera ultunensis]|uniref:hypothetical protein n=1 Tax=Schnuerera ultunensis TaxID=45497 RepID=UPI0003FAC379|nr:hypothetical protein [Schnuerera ultunensis]
MGLYPYTYGAGLTIATEVNKRILSEGQKGIDDWIEVLKSVGNIIDEIIELTEEL